MNATTLTFSPSDLATVQCLTVEIIDDQITEPEPPEEFFVILSTSDQGVEILGTSRATVTIIDDDIGKYTV